MASPLPIRPPIIVHHKAAHDGRFPPNSLEAITACLDADAPFIEIDIMALAVVPLYPKAEYLADRCAALATLVPGASTFYVAHMLLAQSLDDGFNWANALHDLGIKLDVWTVDSTNPAAVTNAKRLLAAGVDQFTTNTPGEMAELLDRAG
jgi:glycerophosphoryl diester phosphodiesterase